MAATVHHFFEWKTNKQTKNLTLCGTCKMEWDHIYTETRSAAVTFRMGVVGVGGSAHTKQGNGWNVLFTRSNVVGGKKHKVKRQKSYAEHDRVENKKHWSNTDREIRTILHGLCTPVTLSSVWGAPLHFPAWKTEPDKERKVKKQG